MKVAIQARLKNGILFEAAKRLGSQSALARHLGVSPMELGGWINFNRSAISVRSHRPPEFWQEIENRLFDLTGHTLEEIFPPEVRTEAFLKRQKKIEAIVEMPIEKLIAAGAVPQLPPAPDDLIFEEEKSVAVNHILDSLKPREAEVIRLRFGLDGRGEKTLEEVAAMLPNGHTGECGVSRNRARQIEATALRRLRHPSKARHLKQWIGAVA